MKKFFQLNPRRKQLVLMALVGLFVLGSFGMGGFALAQQNSSSGSQSQQEFADGGAAAQLAETTPSAAVAEKTSGNWITSWIDSFLSKGVSLLVFAVVGILGVLMELLTWALIVFAQYNGFVKADAVNLGWTLVRDVANMFFVVVLLAIALGTILRIENYNFKKMLPKLLIMAVLVNFSLVIAGIMIDAAQVVMLTFVAAFDEAIGSNIFKTLHITDILTATTQDFQATEGVDFDNVVMNGMLAILFLFIALCVVFVIACMLLVRIVALWILLVLAPMPYILYAFPFTRKYAEQWWSEFVKYLIVGPALAFFLWLAFAVIGNADNLLTTTNAPLDIPNLQPENQAAFIAVAQPAKFLNYIVGIAMLFAGLIVTQKLGVVGGSMAGSVVNKAKSLGTGLLKGTGKWGLRRADDLQARALKGTIGAVGKGLQKIPLVSRAAWVRNAGQGLQSISEKGGAKIRTIPTAWTARQTRVEARRLGQGTEAMTDLFNQAIPFAREKTNLEERARRRQEMTLKKEHADRSTDPDDLIQEWLKHTQEYEYTDKSGVKRKAREIKKDTASRDNANAIMDQLADQGDLNELYKHQNAEYMMNNGVEWKDERGKTGFTAGNIQQFLTVANGQNKKEAARTAMNLDPYSLSAHDNMYKSLAVIDPKTGEAKFQVDDTASEEEQLQQRKGQENDAASYYAKQEPQGVARNTPGRTVAIEKQIFDPATRELLGTKYEGVHGFMENSKAISVASAASQQLNRTKPEAFDAMYANLGSRIALRDAKLREAGELESKGEDLDVAKQNREDARKIEDEVRRIWSFNKSGDKAIDDNKVDSFDKIKSQVASGSGPGPAIPPPIPTTVTAGTTGGAGTGATAGAAAAAAGTSPGVSPSAPRMYLAEEEEKHQRTAEGIAEYTDRGMSEEEFFSSSDYNPELHQTPVAYQRHEAALNQTSLDEVRGVKSAKQKQAGDLQAGVGLNFKDANIQQALGVNEGQDAVYYEGEAKAAAVEAITSVYLAQRRKQAEEEFGGISPKTEAMIQQDVDQLKAGLMSSETLRINNNASKTSRLDQAHHEKAHARTRNLDEGQLGTFWNSLDQAQQEEISADIKKRYGNLDDKRMKQEALAEVLGVGKGKYKMSDKTQAALEGVGVKMTGGRSDAAKARAAAQARPDIQGPVAGAAVAGVQATRQAASQAKQAVKQSFADEYNEFISQAKQLGGALKSGVSETKIAKQAVDLAKLAGKVSGATQDKIQGLRSALSEGLEGIKSFPVKLAAKSVADAELARSYAQQQLNEATTDYERQVSFAKPRKAENLEQAKLSSDQSREAQKKGEMKKAYQLSSRATKLLQGNDLMDAEIASRKKVVDARKKELSEAITTQRKAEERFSRALGEEPTKPPVRQAVKDAVKQGATQLAPTVDVGTDKEIKPQEFLNAAPEMVDESTNAVLAAMVSQSTEPGMASKSNEQVVQGLHELIAVMDGVQKSIEGLGSAIQPDPNVVSELKRLQEVMRNNSAEAQGGSIANPNSLRSVMSDVKYNIKKLNQDKTQSNQGNNQNPS